MDSPYLGMIQYFAFDFTPKYYAQCNGALLPIKTNQALYALLGINYGGDGVVTFGLPDLRGRAIVGMSNGHTLGEKAGSETYTLLTANMPVHTHTATGQIAAYENPGRGGDSDDPTGCYPSTPSNDAMQYSTTPQSGATLAGVTVVVGNAGGSVPLNTLNPYLALNCCITTQGLFPSRN